MKQESDLLEMARRAEVPLAKELVGVVVDTELLRTRPSHPELFGVGRCQEGRGMQGEEDE